MYCHACIINHRKSRTNQKHRLSHLNKNKLIKITKFYREKIITYTFRILFIKIHQSKKTNVEKRHSPNQKNTLSKKGNINKIMDLKKQVMLNLSI